MNFKWTLLGVGSVIGIAHIGLLGYVINRPQAPVINFPKGDYSSYKMQSDRDGYSIEYKANDPAILESNRTLELDKHKRGLFGPTEEKRREYRHDQYTMDGTRNIGGSVSDAEGKHLAKSEECIRADADTISRCNGRNRN